MPSPANSRRYRLQLALLSVLLSIVFGLWGWRELRKNDENPKPPGAAKVSQNVNPPDSLRAFPALESHEQPMFADKTTLLPAASLANELHSPETNGQDDLHLIDSLFIAYRRATAENPSGENYEIVAALTGQNHKHVAVIPKNHSALSADGMLLDRWGSPYYFHSISAQQMEIRSAGPDKKLWSEDDIFQTE